MDPSRFHAVTDRYVGLRVAVLGDFCLDRYLEIDPARQETSLETGLPVLNVIAVRPQPGAAGTVVNNLAALSVGTIYPVGFAGEDGEGFELWQALERLPGVRMHHVLRTAQRRTFTYCKPLVVAPGRPPVELNRLDLKNWTPTPVEVQDLLIQRLLRAAAAADTLIILEQADAPGTGVIAPKVLEAIRDLAGARPDLPILADSRRGLRGFPPIMFKMNVSELFALTGEPGDLALDKLKPLVAALASKNGRSVFVTLAYRGMIGATAAGVVEHVPALPLRGEIDIVGAGDAVSANLAVALAAGASLREALELANAAASVVIHQLGTTGAASIPELQSRLAPNCSESRLDRFPRLSR